MKFLRLVWTGLWRKKLRTIFTLVSIVFAFLLFGLLQGIDTMFDQLVAAGRLNVLDTSNPAGLPLPIADLPQIEAVKGVTRVTYESRFMGDYQSLRNIVVVLPIDAASFFAMNSDFRASPSARAALLHTRTGALVARSLAQRFGWNVGDEVPIQAFNAPRRDGTVDWTFGIVGTFDIPDSPVRDTPLLLVNYAYFDAARAKDTGTAQFFEEMISDASQATRVSNAIDNLFANSAHRTFTETERASDQSQLAQLGDLDFFVQAIVGAAFATLLLLTGTTLMQSYRERTREIAVMKTLGFTDLSVCVLLVSEAVLLTMGAALPGLLIAHALLPMIGRLMARAGAPGLRMPWIVLVSGSGFALLLALASALPPVWRARRLSIVDALAVR